MALESFGTEQARIIDNAAKACHDLILSQHAYRAYEPERVNFKAGEEGLWAVFPSMLDGKPAVEIRLAVG